MNTLLKALNSTAKTLNGAPTNYTSFNYCLDLFSVIGSSRYEDLTSLFSKALVENKDLALKILLWARDIREGAGERKTFRNLLKFLVQLDTESVDKIVWQNKIPLLGRWDDLLVLLDTDYKNLQYIKSLILNALLIDNNGLCAKWMPRKGVLAAKLRELLGWSPKQYRKIIVNLSKTVEQQMSAHQWQNIEYEKLPSIAAKRYQLAFNRHDLERYTQYKEDLKNNKAKINAKAIFPHDIVKSLKNGDQEVANQQWKALPNYLESNVEKILTVSDVSGSMEGLPLDVCVGLTLYLTERLEGVFKNTFITFSDNPELCTVNGDLIHRVSQLTKANWGMSTDLNAVFRLILDTAVANNVPEQDMPTKILILSDMEFNEASSTKTNFEVIKEMYTSNGYKMPSIVFWNLNGRINNLPATQYDNVALVSGFSPVLVKSVLGGETLNPVEVMLKTVDKERYSLI